jgi:hypothetical protein
MRLTALLIAVSLAAGLGAAAAAQVRLQGEVRLTPERIGFDVQGRYTNYTLTIGGPEGYLARAEGSRTPPTVRLADHGDVPDGVYSYQLTAATDQIDPAARRVDQRVNGREPGLAAPRIGAQLSGYFRVEDERIQIFEQIEEPAPGGE